MNQNNSHDLNNEMKTEKSRPTFDVLWREFSGPLRGHLNARLDPVLRANKLEDILQEISLEAYRKFDSFDPDKGSFYTWLLIWARIVLKRLFTKEKDYLSLEMIVRQSGAEPEALSTSPLERLLKTEHSTRIADIYNFFLKTTLSDGGYPHQVIAVLFIKLLYWKPGNFARELSDQQLEKLSEKAKTDLNSRFSVKHSLIQESFQPLSNNLALPLSSIISETDSCWVIITANPDDIVGKTIYPNYWGNRPEANLSNWTYRVWKKVRRILMKNQKIQKYLRDYSKLIV